MVRHKQEELKGMPPKGKMAKEAEMFIGVWERFKTEQSNFKQAKNRLADTMRDHPGIKKVTVTDSTGIKRTIKFDHKESITVTTVKGSKDD